jgi:DNA-binding transcriptional LysR family regulator
VAQSSVELATAGRIDWNDLRIALAVSGEGSLSRAAAKLGVHQTTVGRRLDALEAALSTAIFFRRPTGLVPTSEGARILGTLRELGETLSRVERRLGEPPGDSVVRIAVTENTARLLVAGALPALRDSHPRVAVELVPSNARSDLSRGEVDLAVRMVSSEATDLVQVRLGFVRYGLYASDVYLEARGAPPPHEGGLGGHDVLVPSRELARGPEATWLGANGREARIRLWSSSLVTLALAAERGLGLTVLPTNLAIVHPGLRCLRELPEIPRRPVFLVTHKEARRLADVTAVASAIRTTLERLLEG